LRYRLGPFLGAGHPRAAGAVHRLGQVRLNKIAKIDKHAPLARLTVSGPSASPGATPPDWAGFELTALPAKAVARQIKTDKEVLQFLSWDERAVARRGPRPVRSARLSRQPRFHPGL
jgi:hypothetical protein